MTSLFFKKKNIIRKKERKEREKRGKREGKEERKRKPEKESEHTTKPLKKRNMILFFNKYIYLLITKLISLRKKKSVWNNN